MNVGEAPDYNHQGGGGWTGDNNAYSGFSPESSSSSAEIFISPPTPSSNIIVTLAPMHPQPSPPVETFDSLLASYTSTQLEADKLRQTADSYLQPYQAGYRNHQQRLALAQRAAERKQKVAFNDAQLTYNAAINKAKADYEAELAPAAQEINSYVKAQEKNLSAGRHYEALHHKTQRAADRKKEAMRNVASGGSEKERALREQIERAAEEKKAQDLQLRELTLKLEAAAAAAAAAAPAPAPIISLSNISLSMELAELRQRNKELEAEKQQLAEQKKKAEEDLAAASAAAAEAANQPQEEQQEEQQGEPMAEVVEQPQEQEQQPGEPANAMEQVEEVKQQQEVEVKEEGEEEVKEEPAPAPEKEKEKEKEQENEGEEEEEDDWDPEEEKKNRKNKSKKRKYGNNTVASNERNRAIIAELLAPPGKWANGEPRKLQEDYQPDDESLKVSDCNPARWYDGYSVASDARLRIGEHLDFHVSAPKFRKCMVLARLGTKRSGHKLRHGAKHGRRAIVLCPIAEADNSWNPPAGVADLNDPPAAGSAPLSPSMTVLLDAIDTQASARGGGGK